MQMYISPFLYISTLAKLKVSINGFIIQLTSTEVYISIYLTLYSAVRQ